MDYAALAARCETAPPGRDMDVDIALATLPDLHRTGDATYPLQMRDHCFAPLAHSTRVDDALAALPQGADYMLGKIGAAFTADIVEAGKITASGTGHTQALALWAAIFRRRAKP